MEDVMDKPTTSPISTRKHGDVLIVLSNNPPVVSYSIIGNVQFGGVAFSHDDVATWLDTLAKERGFVNPYFTNSAETLIGTKPFVTFTSSADINDKAKSGRYNKPAGS